MKTPYNLTRRDAVAVVTELRVSADVMLDVATMNEDELFADVEAEAQRLRRLALRIEKQIPLLKPGR